jgi:hypothetical protein
MSKRFEEVVAHCLAAKGEGAGPHPEPTALSRIERIWRWVLRLVLPLLAGLSGLAIYWLWFDHHPGVHRWLEIIVSLPLAGEAAFVMLWAAGSWYFKDMT